VTLGTSWRIAPVVCPFRNIRKAPVVLALTGLLFLLPGCPLSPDDDEGNPPTEIRLDRSSVDETINYVGTVWSNKLYDEYEMVLHDQFEFFPKATDADDFPWMEGDSWARTTELAIAEHMFDPNYSSPEAEAVQTIEMKFSILNKTQSGDTTLVDCTSEVLILVGPDDGFASDTRFIFYVLPDPDEPGLYQISRQEEIERN
jgi:hypothetical protein